MTIISTRLSIIFFLIVSTFLYVLFVLYSTPKQETKNISNLIKIPGISLSSSYLGNRIREYEDETHTVYFGMSKDDFSSFVYAK